MENDKELARDKIIQAYKDNIIKNFTDFTLILYKDDELFVEIDPDIYGIRPLNSIFWEIVDEDKYYNIFSYLKFHCYNLSNYIPDPINKIGTFQGNVFALDIDVLDEYILNEDKFFNAHRVALEYYNLIQFAEDLYKKWYRITLDNWIRLKYSEKYNINENISELEKIQYDILSYKNRYQEASVGELSDGYHSFNDLYNHRAVLTALSFFHLPYAWKSKVHEDGTMYDGMFIVGAPTPEGMISYHYDLKYWDLFKIPVLPHAPHYDGYTDDQVLDRITNYIKNSGYRLVNSKNIDIIENIVQKEILPVFDNDMIAVASFIGFYNK